MQLQKRDQETRLSELRKLAAMAATTGLDMSKPELSSAQVVTSCTTAISRSDSQSSVPLQIQIVARESLTQDKATLLKKYGQEWTEQALEFAKTLKPTRQQVIAKHRREERMLSQQLWRDLRATGVEIRQHSVQDFVRVITRQLELQQKGENPSPQRVLESVFPADQKKAKSIGSSTRRGRWKQAYESDSVRNHPVQIALRETHGKRMLQLRLSARTFRNSLGANHYLFQTCDSIRRLQREAFSLTSRVEQLEEQVRSTKLREALADAGSTSSKEMVLSLRAEGKKQKEIAKLLGMNINTVKSILQRSK